MKKLIENRAPLYSRLFIFCLLFILIQGLNGQSCDTLSTQWETPTPTIIPYGVVGGWITGIPDPVNLVLPTDPKGIYESYFSPDPGAAPVSGALLHLGYLRDDDADTRIQVSVYDDDGAGAPGVLLGGSGLLSPTAMGVPGSEMHDEFYVPIHPNPIPTTGLYHIGVELFAGDANDTLIVLTSCLGPAGCPVAQGEADASNHIFTSGFGYENLLTEYGLDFDIGIIPIMGECCTGGNKIFVDSCASGVGDGSSWAMAYNDLSAALQQARSCTDIDTICVAQGTYIPTDSLGMYPSDFRNVSFTLPDGLVLLGGFAPKAGVTEVADRDWNLYKTILSGDFFENDSTDYFDLFELDNKANRADNVYHVIDQSEVAIGDGTEIDGFCITGGNATETDYYYGYGSGIYLLSSSPQINNCLFQYNSAHEKGGAMLIDTFSSPTIYNCVFINNFTDDDGAGVVNEGHAVFTDCTFTSNLTDDDGAAVNNREKARAIFSNCTFTSNDAYDKGGAVYSRDSSLIDFIDCVFEDNHSHYVGGALYFREGAVGNILRCSFNDNFTYRSGGAIANGLVADGDIFAGGTIDIDSSAFSNNHSEEIGGAISNDFLGIMTVTNSQFSENVAYTAGGAIVADDGQLSVLQCSFTKDSSSLGGAIATNYFGAPPIIPYFTNITSCDFVENFADGGGAIYVGETEATVDKCTFKANEAVVEGGAGFMEGATFTSKNSLYSGNIAGEFGGAISALSCECIGMATTDGPTNLKSRSSLSYSKYDVQHYNSRRAKRGGDKAAAIGEHEYVNNTFTGNQATIATGGAFSLVEVTAMFINDIIWNNQDVTGTATPSSSVDNYMATLSFTNSIVESSGGSMAWDGYFGVDNGNNADEDPLFTTLLDPSVAPSIAGDLSLQCMSPAIDSGTVDTSGFDLGLTDISGAARILSTAIDIGAFEKLETCQEIDVAFEGTSIISGDVTPSSSDGTAFGESCGISMRDFYVKNVAQQVIILDTITVAAVNANVGDFTYNEGSFSFPDTILSGDSILLNISFNATSTGVDSALVSIENNDADEDPYTFTVSAVKDTTDPTAICIDTIVYVDGGGTVSIDSTFIDGGISDNCDVATIGLSKRDFGCMDVGTNPITITVTDVNGNVSTCMSTITVIDTISPVAICIDTMVYVDSGGTVSIDSTFIDGGISDNCEVSTIGLSKRDFGCVDVGINSITITVTDVNGNVSTCMSTITVVDTISPIAICIDTIVYVDSGGTVSIDSTFIDGGISDNCEVATIGLSKSDFGCVDVGANAITITVTDVNGNVSTCMSTITVIDTISPVANCIDTMVYVDSGGTVSIDSTFIDGGISDNCEVSKIGLSKRDFGCVDVGAKPILITVTDVNGNVSTCMSTITVIDTISPIAICVDTMVYVDGGGTVSIDSTFIDGGISDNCEVSTIGLSKRDFGCVDVGANPITITVTDVNGNVSTCMSIITVVDTISPIAICIDTMVYVDGGGTVSIDSTFIDGGISDNCEVATIGLSKSDFGCVDVGANAITITVTDVNGNVSTCMSTITVIDTISPVAICIDTMVYVDGGGLFSIDSTFIDSGISDNCEVSTIGLSKSDFACGDIGANPILITITDVNGNVSTCMSTITVIDTISPIAVCIDTMVYVDGSGGVSIDSTFIDGGISDNCEVSKIGLSKRDFGCVDVGANPITITVTDVNGNVSTCMSTITVVDTISPVAICVDTTVYLDESGIFAIDSSFVDGGISDNCDVATIGLSKRDFGCVDVGANSILITVTDVNGNVSTCMSTVTVIDTISPVAICIDTMVYVDSGGTVSIDSTFIDGGISDNCEVSTIGLTKRDFGCVDVGTNPITITVTDVNGNVSTCVSTVTVIDTISPVAICIDTMVYVDGGGTVSIDSTFIDGGISDNCEVSTIGLSKRDFGCVDVGANPITITVTDVNGNVSTCMSIVTVIDTISPVAVCQDTTVYLDESGNFTIDSTYIDGGISDNCDISTISLSKIDFVCGDVGDNLIVITVTDIHGNVSSCTSNVSVVDTIRPTVICQDITIQLDVNGLATITPTVVDNGSSDACGITGIELSQTSFTCADLGSSPVVLTVTDVNGNTDSCIATVLVQPYSISDIPGITGPSTVCPNLENIPFSVPSIDGVADYQWSYSGVGMTISGNGNKSISADLAGITAGTLTVDLLSSCGVVMGGVTHAISLGSDAFCELASCLRERTFVDNALLSIFNSIDVFKASALIESNVTISPPRTIVFKAGEGIVLYPSFTVDKDATFIAQIEACDTELINLQNAEKGEEK